MDTRETYEARLAEACRAIPVDVLVHLTVVAEKLAERQRSANRTITRS